MVQVGCTALSQGAASETRPLSAHLIETKLLALFTKQTMVLALHTGHVLEVPRRRLLVLQVDIGMRMWTRSNRFIRTSGSSPACQPYPVLNPKAKGTADLRAQSFLHLIEDVLLALAERAARHMHVYSLKTSRSSRSEATLYSGPFCYA